MIRPDLAVIGGGLLGRLLSWRAARDGLRVALFEAGGRDGSAATAWVAAGMITPKAETAEADPSLIAMGRRSLELWPSWLSELRTPVHFDKKGTVILWHRNDATEAKRFAAVLNARDPRPTYKRLDSVELNSEEPALEGRFREALLLPGEAHVDNRQLLPALAEALDDVGVECHWDYFVAEDERPDATLVIDCRGNGAKKRWTEVRGVRGEIIRLHAPDIGLRHMIRLLHPRHSIYLISRPGGNLVVGATAIESDDRSPVSVRGALELLSTAYSVLPELAEARIVEMNSGCRPALPENRPRIRYNPSNRLLEVNGLYRHGFLLSPAMVEEVMGLLPGLMADSEVQPLRWPWLMEEMREASCQ